MNLSKLPIFMLNKIRTSVFTKEDIETYIEELVNFIGCREYYKGIKIDDIRDGTLITYNYHTYKMRVFYKMMLTQGRLDAKYINRDDYILVTNILIIHTIIHEVIHIFQNYCYHNKNYQFLEVLFRQLKYADNCDNKTYNNYYSCFTFERDADSIAYENTLVILRYLVKDAGLFLYYLELFKQTIIAGYQLRQNILYSPIELIYQDLFKEEPPEIEIVEPYQSLKLGLKVSKRQYNNFKRNYQSIIIKNNNLQI